MAQASFKGSISVDDTSTGGLCHLWEESPSDRGRSRRNGADITSVNPFMVGPAGRPAKDRTTRRSVHRSPLSYIGYMGYYTLYYMTLSLSLLLSIT